MKYWYSLPKLDVTGALAPGYQLPYIQGQDQQEVHIFPDHIQINPEWREMVYYDYGLKFWHSLLFWRPAHYTDNVAHIDIDLKHKEHKLNAITINWCLGGRQADLIWYHEPETKTRTRYSNALGQVIEKISWPINELTEATRTSIETIPTMVRTDLPHSVSTAKQARWCFSLRFYPEGMNWQENVDYLQHKGLICGS